MLVGVCDAPVVLFLEFVLHRVRRGIAALPEGLDEIVALFVVGELPEGGALFVGDNPAHVFVQPLFVGLAYFLLESLLVLFLLLFADRTLKRIGFLIPLPLRGYGSGLIGVA